MNGKKFVMYFIAAVILTGTGMGIWIKQAFDTRPKVNISEPENKAAGEPTAEPISEPAKQ